MNIVFFNNHILINDGEQGISRVKYEDAKNLAIQLNNHFALKGKFERAEEGAEDAGPREA